MPLHNIITILCLLLFMSQVQSIRVGNTCSIDYKGDRIVFNPDSAVMRASYSYYSFHKNDFKGVDLEGLQRPFTLKANCQLIQESTYNPNDPNLPKPVGGFHNNTYSCKLISVIEGQN